MYDKQPSSKLVNMVSFTERVMSLRVGGLKRTIWVRCLVSACLL